LFDSKVNFIKREMTFYTNFSGDGSDSGAARGGSSEKQSGSSGLHPTHLYQLWRKAKARATGSSNTGSGYVRGGNLRRKAQALSHARAAKLQESSLSNSAALGTASGSSNSSSGSFPLLRKLANNLTHHNNTPQKGSTKQQQQQQQQNQQGLVKKPLAAPSNMKYKLVISNIQILGNISFLQFIPSKLYLQFQLNDEIVINTKPKEQYYNASSTNGTDEIVEFDDAGGEGNDGDGSKNFGRRGGRRRDTGDNVVNRGSGGCIFDEIIELPFHPPITSTAISSSTASNMGSTNSNSVNSVSHLTIRLYNSGYFINQLVATTTLEFYYLSPPNFQNKVVDFNDWIKNFRVQSSSLPSTGSAGGSNSGSRGDSGKSHHSKGSEDGDSGKGVQLPRLSLSVMTEIAPE
jgi:hypothetical protein